MWNKVTATLIQGGVLKYTFPPLSPWIMTATLVAQGSRLKPTLSACWKQDFGERVWFGLIALSGGPLCTSTLG